MQRADPTSANVGGRPGQWLDDMERLGRATEGPDDFLALGQVLGWRAGLAHYRAGALLAADRLPPQLALRAVGASDNDLWPEVRARLERDVWFDPRTPERVGWLEANRAGAFRGWGGLFVEPPRVAAVGERLFATSGGQWWLVMADVYGATFHRATAAETSAAQAAKGDLGAICRDGAGLATAVRTVRLANDLGGLTSGARTSQTLAITGRWSHSIVFLAARGRGDENGARGDRTDG